MNIILNDKYDIESFHFTNNFIVTLSSSLGIKRLNFGDRIAFIKFYEEEIPDINISSYLDFLGNKIKTSTLIQIEDSSLLKKIEEDTGGFYSTNNLNHYIILAENYVMEIVSFDEVREESI